jgi:epsin
MEMLNSTPTAPAAGRPANNTSAPPPYTAPGAGMFGAAGFGGGMMSPTSNISTPSYMSPMSAISTGSTVFNGNPTPQRSNSMASSVTSSSAKPASSTTSAKGSMDFGDLWSLSLGSSSSTSKPAAGGAGGGKSIQDLQKEKTQAGIWGASQQSKSSSGFAGLGSFGAGTSSSGGAAASGGGGGDDLLL